MSNRISNTFGLKRLPITGFWVFQGSSSSTSGLSETRPEDSNMALGVVKLHTVPRLDDLNEPPSVRKVYIFGQPI